MRVRRPVSDRPGVRAGALVLVAALAGAGWACAGSDAPPPPPVSSHAVLPSADTATLSFEAEVPVPPGADGPPGVAVLAPGGEPGSILVGLLDGSVLVVAPTGSVRSIRPASARGPVTGLAAAADGAVLVRHPGGIHRLDGDGTGLEPWPAVPGRSVPGGDGLVVDRGGAVWAALHPTLPDDGSVVSFPRAVYGRLDDAGRIAERLEVPERLTARCPTLSESHFASGFWEDLRVRYAPKVKWALDPTGGVVFGCPATYRFERHPIPSRQRSGAAAEGSAAWTVDATSDRIPVDPQELWSFTTLWTVMKNNPGDDLGEEGPLWPPPAAPPGPLPDPGPPPTDDAVGAVAGGDERPVWTWENPLFPPERPAYHRILVGRRGRTWIWPAQPPRALPAPDTWPLAGLPSTLYAEPGTGAFDVWGPDGTFVGHVRLPAEIRYTGFPDTPDPLIVGDTVWAVRRGRNGAGTSGGAGLSVARYRVVWP